MSNTCICGHHLDFHSVNGTRKCAIKCNCDGYNGSSLFTQADLDAAVKAALLSTKEVKLVVPPLQQWEVDLSELLRTQYERGYRDGRHSVGGK